MPLNLQKDPASFDSVRGSSYGARLPETRLARFIMGWLLRLQPTIARHGNEGSYLAPCAQRWLKCENCEYSWPMTVGTF
jgi:hypothetical protein